MHSTRECMNAITLSHQAGPTWPAPGSVVSTPIIFGFRHYGIVSDRWENGMPMVISGSNRIGKVVEEPWTVFAPSGRWKHEVLKGPASGLAVVARARSKLGRKYELLSWNCDHLVHYSIGLSPQSPQLALTCAGLAALYIATRITRG